MPKSSKNNKPSKNRNLGTEITYMTVEGDRKTIKVDRIENYPKPDKTQNRSHLLRIIKEKGKPGFSLWKGNVVAINGKKFVYKKGEYSTF